MKKVLILIESLIGGGAERVLTDLVRNLDREKFDVTVMTVVDTGVYREEVKACCTYESMLPDPASLSGYFSKLRYKLAYRLVYHLPSRMVYQHFIKTHYDIEIAFIEGYVTRIIAGSKNPDSLKLAWVHVDPLGRDYADLSYKNHEEQVEAYRAYHRILCVSRYVEEAFRKKFGFGDRTIVQYNPVDRNAILMKSREDSGKVKTRLTLVTVGRLTRQKGYDRLLDVCSRLKKDGFDFDLWVLGEGEEREALTKGIEDLGLQPNVELLGFRRNPYPYILQADLFVCSSRAEGFSTVATEAVILGKAVVTTDCSGMQELLGDSEYGLITANDTDSLYQGVKRLLTQPEVLETYRARALARGRDFSMEKTMEEIEAILMDEAMRIRDPDVADISE